MAGVVNPTADRGFGIADIGKDSDRIAEYHHIDSVLAVEGDFRGAVSGPMITLSLLHESRSKASSREIKFLTHTEHIFQGDFDALIARGGKEIALGILENIAEAEIVTTFEHNGVTALDNQFDTRTAGNAVVEFPLHLLVKLLVGAIALGKSGIFL